ncbi:MAG: 4Fe-4S ferredoxin, partial [Paracoccaceae bacterium]|nr:4Fe-4S ferredoxin [Paracoccaceae bacterium]
GVLVLALAALFWAMAALRPTGGEGFYAVLSHNAMVAIFAPAFLLPLLSVAIGLRAYWREVGAGPLRLVHLSGALRQAASLRNLNGGQGQGCNFEAEDRYSDRRRWLHQAVMYGFLLCFAATSSATLLHYLADMPAPYELFSLPKLLGVPGGVLMVIGATGLVWLKTRADPALGARRVWGGEMAFVVLLAWVALSGLALYAATGVGTGAGTGVGTGAVAVLLALHLGAVLGFFVLLPFTKMVHGFFRLTALVAEESKKS